MISSYLIGLGSTGIKPLRLHEGFTLRGMDGFIKGLAGVSLWTAKDHFAEMRHFYVETLQLRPHTDGASRVNFVWQGVRLAVAVHDRIAGVGRDPLRVMINLEVQDLDQAHSHLLEAGVLCLRSPEAEGWGGRVATYQDPDGNVIQLLELNPP